jgi:hypothetical protein
LGADARATLFRGETADGTRYAVKVISAPQPGLVVADFLDFADDVLDVALDPPARAAALRIAAGAVSAEGLVTITLSEAAADH